MYLLWDSDDQALKVAHLYLRGSMSNTSESKGVGQYKYHRGLKEGSHHAEECQYIG